VVVPLQVRSRHRSRRRRRRRTRHARTQAGGYQFRAGVAQWGNGGPRAVLYIIIIIMYSPRRSTFVLFYFCPAERTRTAVCDIISFRETAAAAAGFS